MSSSDKKDKFYPYDIIRRGVYTTNYVGTATLLGLRAADPLLQYQILQNDWGSALIERLGGTVLPRGPPLITSTPLDNVVGLSPYRSILLAMSFGGMLKQNIYFAGMMQEEMTVGIGAAIGAFNVGLNSINSLLFVCSQTSASVNGEHFPQTPLIVGASMYTAGIFLELFSEIQRSAWKKDPANKGKVYTGGLFGLSRHINYFGYMLWRAGYSLAAGGWAWGAFVGSFFVFDFTQRAIPMLQNYMEEKYGEEYKKYEEKVPYKFVPYVY